MHRTSTHRLIRTVTLTIVAVAFAGGARFATLQADDAAVYAQIVEQIRKELAIPFSSPDDPELQKRRARLRTLFAKVPPSHAKVLLDRLGTRPTDDELSTAFHGKLASPTRREMLEILAKIPPPPPPKPESKPAPTPVFVWPTEPLPASESARFDAALASLRKRVAASNDPRKWRYDCWFEKLKRSDVDDRLIEWPRICPVTGVVPLTVGPCDIAKGRPVDRQTIHKAIRSVADVDANGAGIGIITHLKADIVVAGEMTAMPFENLQTTHDNVTRAIDKLEKWADVPLGGSSSMSPDYVSIKEWIGRRQRDPASPYSCK
jgi:hypothetical protein